MVTSRIKLSFCCLIQYLINRIQEVMQNKCQVAYFAACFLCKQGMNTLFYKAFECNAVYSKTKSLQTVFRLVFVV